MGGRRRYSALVGPVLYTLAFSAVGVAGMAPTSPPAASRPIRSRSSSCPIPVGQQVKAVNAFRAMMPVFRHPRCINCHGAFDIASEAHEGSEVVAKSGLNPRALLTAKERKKLHESCGNCHDNIEGHLIRLDSTRIEGWLVAPLPMLWTGKNDDELCMLMKRFEPTGEQFVDHLETDHREIQFIKAAFHGDRALGTALEGKPEPPPGTQAELVDKARKWVKLVSEEGYTASPECGCVMPKIKLKVHHTMEHNLKNGLPSREASEVAFEVKLLPVGEDNSGTYQGQLSGVREVKETVPKYCKAGGFIKEHWNFSATLTPGSDSMTVWRSLVWEDPVEVIDCGRFGTLTDTFRDSELGNGEPFTMSADSGSTKELTEQSRGDKESLSITVLEVPR